MSYEILNILIRMTVIQHVMKAAEFIGHEIKENTELAEHEAGINNFKKESESVFNKIKNLRFWYNQSN
jgi:hypothetical protein